MAKRGYIPTVQEVRDLADRAEKGDKDALSELGELNNKLAKRANQRMRDLERKGMIDKKARINKRKGVYEGGTAAYNKAKYWLSEEADFSGNDYFSQSRHLKVEDAVSNIEAASEYLRSQTSTTAGENTRRKKIADALESAGFFNEYIQPDAQDESGTTDALKSKLIEMFDTDAWADLRRFNKGGTNQLVAEAVDALSSGALIGDLKRAFKDFQRDKVTTDRIEIWDNWSSAQKYYRAGAWHELQNPRR